MTNAEKFKSIFRGKITRPDSAELLAWLENKTDFFTAPASTKYHGAYPGGLVDHSLNVYDAFMELQKTGRFTELAFDMGLSLAGMEETAAICALLHDVCKTDYYAPGTRRQKNAAGEWETVPCYTVKDGFPLGHGEKSVFLIQQFISLRTEEALAIRWHMGPYDEAARGGSRGLSEAMAFSPLVYELHAADMRATQREQQREREGKGAAGNGDISG